MISNQPAPQKFLDRSWEVTALASAIQEGATGVGVLSADLFACEDVRTVYALVSKHYAQHSSGTLSPAALSDLVSRARISDVEQRARLHDAVDDVRARLAAKDRPDVLYCAARLKELYTQRALYDLALSTADTIGKSSGTALADIRERLLTIDRTIASRGEVLRRSWATGAEERLLRYADVKRHPAKYAGIPWGLHDLDRATYGLHKPWFALFFARPGVGKTRLMVNLAYNMARMRKKVMYVSLEMPLEIIEQIFDSRDSMLPIDNIMWGRLSPRDEQAHRQVLTRLRRRQDILEIIDVARGFSVTQLEGEFRAFQSKYGSPPDVVFIDYVGLMEPTERTSNEREKYDNILLGIHQTVKIWNVAAVSVLQMSRAGINARTLGLEHVYGTDQAAHHCELLASLEQDAFDETRGLLHVQFYKNRYGPHDIRLTLFADWARNYVGDRVIDLQTGVSTATLEQYGYRT